MSAVVRKLFAGRYLLSEEVTTGGSARVYKAIDADPPNRTVAVKILERSAQRDDALLNLMFDRETRAFRRLRHPNIVELLDGGRDPDTGNPYFVFEWIDRDLARVLKDRKLEGWDSFAETYGLQIIGALAYAHGEGIAHRDIKPSNVLVTGEAVPKLTDFGIAKLRSDLQPGPTLADFQTRPYAPKEFDNGEYTFTRDVHAFGVLVLMSVTGIDPFADRYRADPYQAVADALEIVDLPPEVHDLVVRCVSDDPRERPLNAVMASAELLHAQEKRTGAWVRPSRIHFVLPIATARRIRETLNLPEATDMPRLLEEELSGDVAVMSWPDRDQKPRDDYFKLMGDTLQVHVKVREEVQDALLVLAAYDVPHSLLLKRREHAYRLRLEAHVAEPSDRAEAKARLTELQIAVVTHERDEAARERLAERSRIFWTWKHTLDAKVDLEREREDPLGYERYEVARGEAFFDLAVAAGKDVLGQQRRAELRGGGFLVGLVSDIRRERLVLSILAGDASRLPRAGVLRIDNRAARSAIQRQQAAVEAVQFKQALRPDLDELLIEPERAHVPRLAEGLDFVQANLDDPKREAVRAALGSDDFLVVHGPPGTGKTTFIAEVVLQLLKANSGMRILVTSQTHAALDNVLVNLKSTGPTLKMVRIARPEDPKVSPQVSDLLTRTQIERWREEVVRQGREYLRAWASANGLSDRAVEIAGIFEDLAAIAVTFEQQADAIRSAEGELARLKNSDPSTTAEEGSTIAMEIAGLREQQDDLDNRRREAAARLKTIGAISNVSELDDLSADELASRATQHVAPDHPAYRQCLELLKLRADWQARFGLGEEFQAAVLLRSQVVAATCLGVQSFRGADAIEFDVCIVDEASRATATEMLVPLIQARRWILVGDPKQLPPFVESALTRRDVLAEHDLTEADVRETLFERLIARLPEACQRVLSMQHRMVPAIGNLISQVFYGGQITTGDVNAPSWLWAALPKPVTWYTTSKRQWRQEQSLPRSFSRQNQLEAEVIRFVLERFQFCAASQKASVSVAVLTGYVAQRDLIERVIAEKAESWKSLNVECSTVDAFQGRQADLCIYSVTRSNSAGDLGFLREEPRLNVALSRGRYGLVLVGDHMFVREARDDPNPLASVLDYVERHPDDCSLTDATT